MVIVYLRRLKILENPKEDRRIRRTKRLLKQGLALMMAEKEFKDITVKDITEKVDLNRSTFYLHYTDTYDLLEKLENDTLRDFQNMIEAYSTTDGSQSLRPMFEAIADYVLENSDTCRIMFENKASGNFFVKFKTLIERNGTVIIQNRIPGISQKNLEYYFAFIPYGAIGILKQWFNEDMKAEKDAVVDFANNIVETAAKVLR